MENKSSTLLDKWEYRRELNKKLTLVQGKCWHEPTDERVPPNYTRWCKLCHSVDENVDYTFPPEGFGLIFRDLVPLLNRVGFVLCLSQSIYTWAIEISKVQPVTPFPVVAKRNVPTGQWAGDKAESRELPLKLCEAIAEVLCKEKMKK